ncbi:hypothetical protein NLX86_20695 [Streptomyces sp. A3M-1-3]|uniref:hypothetical protein n=1 Tax=Streptomyces sp. A3M-1-3 TaxID=2962044 RepID=UPI0020B65693|nr:hypothetical protein [Streptomyces sp. A3M-1-3]MCP3820426.1 hypothetical protein [Streptomyces sp. A3M-1-3]
MRISASNVAAIAALALIPTIAGVSSATAGGAAVQGYWNCPSNGYITPGDRCTQLTNGVLKVSLGDNGSYVDSGYEKTGGSAVTAKVGFLRTGTNRWAASQTMKAGLIYRKNWSPVASPCSPTNGLLYSGGTTYQTPAADTC